MVRKGNVLAILSWGLFVWYRPVRPMVTVGELRQQLAKEVGRLFDGIVVGLELLITGTEIAPELMTPLIELTQPPFRNVCLDVVGAARSSPISPSHSVAERILRKHLSGERFQAGLAQRLWRLIDMRWPYAAFGIGRGFRGNCGEVALRFNLEKYPTVPPLVELWNLETQTAIEARYWPPHFVRFVTTNYPEFADIATESYCSNLLRISSEIASRLKHNPGPEWDVTQDLTQLLSRASACFRQPRSVNHQKRRELCSASQATKRFS
jgi:hypothetical protein